MNGQAGKGDRRRPMFITDEQWAKNYNRACGKKKKKRRK